MNRSSEIREFLVSRRARITPDQAGLPTYGGTHRRVKGLRREQAALLPLAGGTLVPVPVGEDSPLVPSLLTLSFDTSPRLAERPPPR